MKEKKIWRLMVLGIATVLLACGVTGCMSMSEAIVKSMIKDYGVYDNSVPEDQLSELVFLSVNVKTFDGNQVKWGDKANNGGRVKVPAGTHTFVYDYLMELPDISNVNYNSTTGTTTYTFTTTTTSLNNITISQMEFLPGHKYCILGFRLTGGVQTIILDITNAPAGRNGDQVANAPKKNNTPTEFEGTWKGSSNMVFNFTGNTWVWTIPPGAFPYLNPTSYTLPDKGTFEITGNKLVLYHTHTGGTKKYFFKTATRQTFIFTYSFEGENLLLELEYLLPPVMYSKQ